MTCTEESVVPIPKMTLHAILRLTNPTHDLAADNLLLMAAREGHLVTRDAVSALLQQKDHDLRAAITELQFWCQMGVGDPRGGLSWIFQRWPPGTGETADGLKQRVVSQGVYPNSIGCLPQEERDDEETLLETWQNWGCLLYTSPSPRDGLLSRMPSSA